MQAPLQVWCNPPGALSGSFSSREKKCGLRSQLLVVLALHLPSLAVKYAPDNPHTYLALLLLHHPPLTTPLPQQQLKTLPQPAPPPRLSSLLRLGVKSLCSALLPSVSASSCPTTVRVCVLSSRLALAHHPPWYGLSYAASLSLISSPSAPASAACRNRNCALAGDCLCLPSTAWLSHSRSTSSGDPA